MSSTISAARQKVLMIYTGGTIGMLPSEEGNPLSPLKPAKWEALRNYAPALKQLPVEVVLHEMRPIASSNMDAEYWLDIARVIRDHYSEYDGFVVVHGTDTMAYTASALSFLLENVGKPVILTGAQISIAFPRSDAVQNLVTALMLASPGTYGLPVVPEVCICFGNRLLRGNRARKVSSTGYAGFDTPNYPHLAEIGEHIKVNREFVRRLPKDGFFIHETLERNVMLLDLFPGIQPAMLHSVFGVEGLKGIVLRTYGTGNAPTDEAFLREIDFAVTDRGIVVVSVSQCNQGTIEMGLYETSAILSRHGVIGGGDMTPEAALVKMMFLFGQGYDTETVKAAMQKDLRGEQSVNAF